MPNGTGTGLGIGFGEMMGDIGAGLEKRAEYNIAQKEKQRDQLQKASDNIAQNLVEATGGMDVAKFLAQPGDHTEVQNLLAQLNKNVHLLNASYGLHETPQMIQRFRLWGKKYQPPETAAQPPALARQPGGMTPPLGPAGAVPPPPGVGPGVPPGFKVRPADPEAYTAAGFIAQAPFYHPPRAAEDYEARFKSLYKVYKQVHPDWPDQKIQDEVLKIVAPGRAAAFQTGWMISPDGQSHEVNLKDPDDVNSKLDAGWKMDVKRNAVYDNPKQRYVGQGINKTLTGYDYHGRFVPEAEIMAGETPEAQYLKPMFVAEQTALKGSNLTALQQKNEAVNNRFQQTLFLREQAQYAMAQNKNFAGMSKDLIAATKDLSDAESVRDTMRLMFAKAFRDPAHPDQQAMVYLLANHLGMTAGMQKGTRVTQALLNEAMNSGPWFANAMKKLNIQVGPDTTWGQIVDQLVTNAHLLEGIVLTQDQANSMVDLAESRTEQLKVHITNMQQHFKELAPGLPLPQMPTMPGQTTAPNPNDPASLFPANDPNDPAGLFPPRPK